MAIDFTAPTIKPPGASDVFGEEDDSPTVEDLAGGQGTEATPTGPAGEDATSPATPTSRYASPIIQQGLDLIRKQGKTAQEESMATLGERMTQRGLVGSGIEATETSRLLEQLNRQRMQEEYGLVRDFAATESADRSTWANIAIQTRAQELQKEGMDKADALAQAQFEQEKYQFGAGIEQQESEFSRALHEQQAARLSALGFSREELDQQAAQFQQTAAQEGKRISLTEARDLAEQEIRLKALANEAAARGEQFDIDRARMSLQSEQFDREISLRQEDIRLQSELEGRRLTQSELRLEAEKVWAIDELGEKRSARLSQENISAKELALRADEIKRTYKLADDELARDYAELDMRRTDLLSQRGIDSDRLKLDADRIRTEEREAGRDRSQRWAMQEAEIRARRDALREQLTLDRENLQLEAERIRSAEAQQGRQISSDEAMQRAELEWSEKEQNIDVAAQAEMQRDRITAERAMFDSELKQKSDEFTKSLGLDKAKYETDKNNALAEIQNWKDERTHDLDLFDKEAQEALLDRQTEYVLQSMVNSGAITREEYRADAETAWRKAARKLQANLATFDRKHEGDMQAATHDYESQQRNMDRGTELMIQKMGIDADTFRSMTELVQMSDESMQAFLGWDPDTETYDQDRMKEILGDKGFQRPGEWDITSMLDLLNKMRNWQSGMGEDEEDEDGGGGEDDDESEDEVIRGCMDPDALNYNGDATEDDGGCEYKDDKV